MVSEFHRRCRIGAGGFQSIGILWRLLAPRHGWVAFTFLSHKVLRWLCPFFLILGLVGNALLVNWPEFRALFVAQLAFYALSLVGGSLPARPRALRVLRLPAMFTMMNAALFVGFWRWALGWQKAAWRRTQREETLPAAVAGPAAAPQSYRYPELAASEQVTFSSTASDATLFEPVVEPQRLLGQSGGR
jgi:hypothetical protein